MGAARWVRSFPFAEINRDEYVTQEDTADEATEREKTDYLESAGRAVPIV